MTSRLAWISLMVSGCCHTPHYLEPHGHSATYREHVDRFDDELAHSVVPVIVYETVPPTSVNARVPDDRRPTPETRPDPLTVSR